MNSSWKNILKDSRYILKSAVSPDTLTLTFPKLDDSV